MKKIYGEYQGSIENRYKVKALDEIDLWAEIDALAGYLSLLNYYKTKGDFKNINTDEDEYALEYLMYQTTNFGVDLNLPEDEHEHIEQSDSYKAWYNFYANYFKKELPYKEYKKFLKLRKEGLDTSNFVPKGNWKEKCKMKQKKR